jgi:PKD repeat protein
MIVSQEMPRLLPSSPCVNAGTNFIWMSSLKDIDGEPRCNGQVDIGFDEVWAANLSGDITAQILMQTTAAVVGYPLEFEAAIAGPVAGFIWSFGDGVVCENNWQPQHSYAAFGDYLVTLTVSNLSMVATATTVVHIFSSQDRYVAVTGNDTNSGLTWASAKLTIQAAVDVALAGCTVWVSNGVYSSGGRVAEGQSLTNRVWVDKPVSVQSVNGPQVTTIVGGTGTRGVYLSSQSKLIGFTVRNGRTFDSWNENGYGGGIYCDDISAVVSNSVLRSNWAHDGGGVYGGTLYECAMSNNYGSLSGGGAYVSTLSRCYLRSNSCGFNGGGGANRCVLWNCVVAKNTSAQGGGVYKCAFYNCTITENTAWSWGGGAFDCTAYNSFILCNRSEGDSGGAEYGTYYNCSIIGNSAADDAGGVSGGRFFNCILYYNTSPAAANFWGGTFSRSCTTPLPAGEGNMDAAPQIACSTNPRLLDSSPCINTGLGQDWMREATDIEGENRQNAAVDIGADEFWAMGQTGALAVAISAVYTQAVAHFSIPFQCQIQGRASGLVWHFGDGRSIENEWCPVHAYSTSGVYQVVLTVSNLGARVSATTTVQIVALSDFYVSVTGADSNDGRSWPTAKQTIQSAVDLAQIPGSTIWVSNGVYSTGGRAASGQDLLSRVVVNRPVVLRSVNGPHETLIVGQADPVGTNGVGAVRGVYLTDRAILDGFSVMNGCTRLFASPYGNCEGGAVYCSGPDASVTNCILSANAAGWKGGAVYGGRICDAVLQNNWARHGGAAYGSTVRWSTLVGNDASWSGGGGDFCAFYDCVIQSNIASEDGGAARSSIMRNCVIRLNKATYGGGCSSCTLDNCFVVSNTASYEGGGADNGTLKSCVLAGNSASVGGGSYNGMLQNCTLTGNAATSSGGGAYYGVINNCIVYYNTSASYANHRDSTMTYSCTTPSILGTGNISSLPRFENTSAANYRLSVQSPCVNTGNNQDWMFGATDLEGKPRIRNGTVDMGAYEFVFEADLKGLLQGPYNTNSQVMATSINGNLPKRPPYAADRRSVTSVPSNMVDWVLLEVQDTNRNALASTSVFVDQQGRIRDAAGGTNIPVEVSSGSYYLVLRHRNHLAAISSLPVAFTNTVVSYDFTTGSDQYMDGTNACVELEPGVWGLIGGDADGDGRITPVDRIIVERQKGKTGYLQGDLNLDGRVDGGDQ